MSKQAERNFLNVIVPSQDAEVDIVAVHGLNPFNTPDHAEATWTKNGIVWLSDAGLLPKEIPNARVLLFGYNSNVAIESGNVSILAQAENLLSGLETERKDTSGRAIVFLCHSLGGLVVKEALRTAMTARRFQEIYQYTRGIVFFGTPHRGANGVQLGNVLASAVRFMLRGTSNQFLDTLYKDSQYAEALNRQFVDMLDLRPLPIVSVFETRPMKKFGLNAGIVVNPESATLGLSTNAELKLPRDEDHSGVCTYDDSKNSNFKQVIHNIKQFIRPEQFENRIALRAGPRSLIQLDFERSDIAMLLGSGRTITWMTVNNRDRELLSTLDLRSEDLISRKGILETATLQARWGNGIRVLKEGRAKKFQTLPRDDMGTLTWLMTLIYAVLQSSLPLSLANEIMIDFFVRLVEDFEEIEEHLRGELPLHLEGWRSFSSVKGIEAAARREWNQLGLNGEHPPGFIPSNDQESILEFLLWLTQYNSRDFETSSSDVYCLALILQFLGISLLHATKTDTSPKPNFDENNWVVTLNTQLMRSVASKSAHNARKGMRIPLDCMEESVSPWPIEDRTMDARKAFLFGKEAGEALKFALQCDFETRVTMTTTNQTTRGLYYQVTTTDNLDKSRIGHHGLEWIGRTFFPFITKELSHSLRHLAQDWTSSSTSTWGLREENDKTELLRDKSFFGLLQSFVLGYYYGGLSQMIDTSQLSVREAYGSWGWWDFEVLQVVRDVWAESPNLKSKDPSVKHCWRFALLKVMGYLFAGAEVDLIRRCDNRATGVVAKLCLLSASMLGESTDSSTAARFHLLDIDGSCIPNRMGIVMSGQQLPSLSKDLSEHNFQPLEDHSPDGSQKDFTVHIQPDRQTDKDSCLIAYRDAGRMVQLLSPTNIDAAMVTNRGHPDDSATQTTIQFLPQPDSSESTVIHIIPIDMFHGGNVARRPEDLDPWQKRIWEKPLLVPTRGLPKARACIMTMFSEFFGWEGYTPREKPRLDPRLKDSVVLYDDEARPIVLP